MMLASTDRHSQSKTSSIWKGEGIATQKLQITLGMRGIRSARDRFLDIGTAVDALSDT